MAMRVHGARSLHGRIWNFPAAPSWKCDYRISALSNSTSQSSCLLTKGSYQQPTPEQGGRIDHPTSSRHQYLWPKTTRWPLRLSNHFKALWVDSLADTLCAQLQTCFEGALRKSSRPEDELKGYHNEVFSRGQP